MNYSLHTLNTVADCDFLLSKAAKERADLDYKKITDERMTTRYNETSVELAADLQGVITEITALETIIAALPEGPTKDDAQDKKVRLEYRKFVIENRMENFGAVALLQKEMDLARVNLEIGEVDAFITAVEEKRATLVT